MSEKNGDMIQVYLDENTLRKKILDNEIEMHYKNYRFTSYGEPVGYYIGDKIIINKDIHIYSIEYGKIREVINRNQLDGMIATINSISARVIDVDINGRKAKFDTVGFNPEVIEREYKVDYREDLLNIADDIDGVLLKNINPPTELIQKNIKKGI